MGAWHTFFHPRRTTRELAEAEEQLFALTQELASERKRLADETDDLRRRLDDAERERRRSETSLETITAQLLETRQQHSQTQLLLRDAQAREKEFRKEIAHLQERLAEQADTDAQLQALDERLTRAEKMKTSYISRISELKKEIERLRAERPDDTDTEWYTPLPPDL